MRNVYTHKPLHI